ncbi:UxaA family hydrolase [Oceanibaculum pacificum]|uniref:Galactonate dehydratase n=1 Tax=Oceanibaculum pacificum TaxID=580166 RepID=A0A154WH21_9PROT|nr:altronate dehydratase family protein [Oceanibaculum pacificum]KZD12769.1 galactonate dehydratase [Oceanibaculum pacificum]
MSSVLDAPKDALFVRLHPADNVVVARLALMPGTALPGEGVSAAGSIPAGHKVATKPIAAGEPVRKYNQIIGFATEEIAAGAHVHVHNVEMQDFERDYAFSSDMRPTDMVPEAERATFQGFVRKNGTVGTRNYIGILTSVNCSATVAKYIAAAVTPEILAQYPNVDGVVALVHSTGCGMADTGEGYANLQRTLWGYARHPNFAGILMVGLGCEVNQIDFLLEAYGLERGPRFQTMTIQDTGGTRKTVDRGVEIVKSMLPVANEATRSTVPASHLTLALQCGGSDGYSGITANPALGAAADLLVRHGGTAILSETPEIYGAEHLLTRRAVDRKIGEKLIERIRWWEDYTERNGGEMNNNPSPGNKAGGLTTILEKSLGAAAKGGTTNLTGVFKYAEPVNVKGFVFMDSPGYDPCSVTGQVASGANVICFTTGRGSVFGCKPSPSIKLATNSLMYRKLSEDMDVNCGAVLDEGVSIQEMGRQVFELILRVASGEKSKSEAQGFGDAEFIPWQVGAVM